MTSLRPEHWSLLASLADAAGDWLVEDATAPSRRRRTTVVEQLASEQLCELASAHVLNALHDADDRRPWWAARILPDGVLVLRYRRLRGTVPRQLAADHAALTTIELTSAEVDILRRLLMLAPQLPGIHTRTLATALTQALPVPGTARWSLNANTEQLSAVEAAFRLEALTGSCRSYHRFLREYREYGRRVRVGLTVGDA
jgi:hypothetical protein